MEDFRSMLQRLQEAGLMDKIEEPVDVRELPRYFANSAKALYFNNIKDYSMPVVGGIFWTRERLAKALGCREGELGHLLLKGIENPIPVSIVNEAPVQEVVCTGEEVDLTELPIPFLHDKDGGAYITSGVVVADDEEFGFNAGMYRLMYRTPQETGIDLVSPSGLRKYYQKKLEKGEPLPISVALGVHGYEALAATYKAPLGVNEMEIAGGMHGRPVEMVRCKTNNLLVPANAEIVLEGELLPIGWEADEGPFGEFAGMNGDLKWNPVFRITAITRRKDSIFYSLLMPWENAWLGAPMTEAAVWRILKEVGVQTKAVKVVEGSACRWSVVASIANKTAGEGKNAVLALLALPEVKQAIVTDDDIDIFNQKELDWALTFKVQPDRDVYILSGLKAKHVDPSVRPWELAKGQLPVTSKIGIDATIPEGIPKIYYERIKPAVIEMDDEKNLVQKVDLSLVFREIVDFLSEKRSFFEVVQRFRHIPYPQFLKAWGRVREEIELERDQEGRYSVSSGRIDD